jgi:hypothetical protein
MYTGAYGRMQKCGEGTMTNDIVSELVTQGRLAVINAEVLVVLPETVRPEHIGRLSFFKFEAESDAPDGGDSA